MNTRKKLLRFLPFLLLLACGRPAAVNINSTHYQVGSDGATTSDTALERMIAPYRSQLSSTMSAVLCTSAAVLERGTPEGTLGDFVADVCLSEGNQRIRENTGSDSLTADFVVLNNGGLRKPLPKGSIALGDVYELMPFENKLVLLELSGVEVDSLSQYIAGMNGTPVSGIHMIIDKNSGDCIECTVGGSPLDPDRIYRVMTADYLANGGDKFPFPVFSEIIYDTGLKIRDALIDYCTESGKKSSVLSVQLDGRIRYRHE
jgi:2',3'-cyclic-nucleotide 2'-phosphodiesterase (5'-nucleotidase family)